ncbi:MAG: hypothetical protein A3J46_04490 [Candidatus Yanofskybacteria bacterium RIFCSPHIGHO2_02_FULL_41_11]|uniref:CopG-like ribbon-helix-helix domain-containing protein n=1 Tax=Candidatus Yanofskybacteria bacterium RIFCSPHIGHO2_02_FULL_41_11 TaxID=1802675 RepID=A0A1F8FBL8_9BACT|nr:MAG: hypothetical protein A3J46_04490 [Candidatus Yanofskybacteria bacterium RIFCSPHIGHO2_02_FULL_41_11]
MPTTKTRINISLSDDIIRALTSLAGRDHVPKATKAARLLEIALEIEEDQVWNKLAEKREADKSPYLSHKKAWQ